MSFIATLTIRDLRASSRRRFHRLRRIIPLLICFLLIALLSFWGALSGQTNAMGLVLFRTLLPIALLLPLVMAPLAGGTLASTETEEGALDMLLMTGIRLPTFMMARFLSAFLQLTFLVGGLLPLLFLCVGLGGVSLTQLGLGVLLILSVSIAGSALGLLAATVLGRRFPLIALSLVLFWAFILPPLVNLLPKGAYSAWLAIFPFDTCAAILRGTTGPALWVGIACHAILALLFLGITLAVILWRQDRPAFLPAAAPTVGRPPLPAIPDQANPIRWRELHIRYGSRCSSRRMVRLLIVLSLGVGAGMWLIDDTARIMGFLAGSIVFIAVSCPVVLMALYLWRNIDAYTPDGPGMKDMLILADIDGKTIVSGKHSATLRVMQPIWITWAISMSLWFVIAWMKTTIAAPIFYLLFVGFFLIPSTYFSARVAAWRSLQSPGEHVRNMMIAGLCWIGAIFFTMISNVIICGLGIFATTALLFGLGVFVDSQARGVFDRPTGYTRPRTMILPPPPAS